MAERIKLKTVMSAEEALRIEIIVNQALIDILVDKQIISEEELIAGVRRIKRKQQKLSSDTNKVVAMQDKKIAESGS